MHGRGHILSKRGKKIDHLFNKELTFVYKKVILLRQCFAQYLGDELNTFFNLMLCNQSDEQNSLKMPCQKYLA